MINDVGFSGQVLIVNTLGDGAEIDLGHKINQAITMKDKIFVRFDTECFEGTEFYNRNIICLNEQGRQLWRVEDPDWYRSGKMKTKSPFTSIRIKGSRLIGFTWDCFDIPIDVETGKLSKDWEFTK